MKMFFRHVSLAFSKVISVYFNLYSIREWIDRSTQRLHRGKIQFNWNTHAPYKNWYVCVDVVVGQPLLNTVFSVSFRFALFCFVSFFVDFYCVVRFSVTATCFDDRADFCARLCISFSIKCCNATFFIHSVNITTTHCVRAHIDHIIISFTIRTMRSLAIRL